MFFHHCISCALVRNRYSINICWRNKNHKPQHHGPAISAPGWFYDAKSGLGYSCWLHILTNTKIRSFGFGLQVIQFSPFTPLPLISMKIIFNFPYQPTRHNLICPLTLSSTSSHTIFPMFVSLLGLFTCSTCLKHFPPPSALLPAPGLYRTASLSSVHCPPPQIILLRTPN